MKSLIRFAVLAGIVFALYRWKGAEWLGQQETTSVEADIIRKFSHGIVLVEGKSGSGSGFIAAMGGKNYVLTNQHVAAGNSGAIVTTLDRSPLKTGAAAAAVGHDIMSVRLMSDGEAMEVMQDVMANAAIGDDVAVLGNSNGDRVIKPLLGKLVAVGPDRIEVSSEFVKGNSGSPIIHLKSGQVIGIATFAVIRKVDSLTGTRRAEPEVKRFGYRLDSVKQWQPVDWTTYNEDFQTLDRINTRTMDLVKLLTAQDSNVMSSLQYKDSAIRVPLARFASAIRGQGLIKTSPADAAKNLVGSLRTSCDSDIVDAQQRLKYDYFRRELRDHQLLREQFYKEFDRLMKVISGR